MDNDDGEISMRVRSDYALEQCETDQLMGEWKKNSVDTFGSSNPELKDCLNHRAPYHVRWQNCTTYITCSKLFVHCYVLPEFGLDKVGSQRLRQLDRKLGWRIFWHWDCRPMQEKLWQRWVVRRQQWRLRIYLLLNQRLKTIQQDMYFISSYYTVMAGLTDFTYTDITSPGNC